MSLWIEDVNEENEWRDKEIMMSSLSLCVSSSFTILLFLRFHAFFTIIDLDLDEVLLWRLMNEGSEVVDYKIYEFPRFQSLQ